MDASMSNVNDAQFAEFPQPPAFEAGYAPKPKQDDLKYLNGLDAFINSLGVHIRQMQEDVGKRMKDFAEDLEKGEKTNAKKKKKDDADQAARQEYNAAVGSVWRRRKQYREIMKDAVQERQRFLDSMMLQKKEDELIRTKMGQLQSLSDAAELEKRETRDKSLFDFFSVIFLVVQVVLMLVYVVTVNFRQDALFNSSDPALRADDSYTFLYQIALMVIFGFGFLMAHFRKYAFSSTAGTLLSAVFAVEIGLLTQLLWANINENAQSGWQKLDLTVPALIDAFYVAAAVVVTFGCINGKAAPLEMLLIALFEAFFYGLNYYVCILQIKASDPGGAMTIHLFGSVFGLTLSYFLSKPFTANELRPYLNRDETSWYHGDVLSIIASLFLFCFFPAFNAAAAPDGSQHRVIINTLVALIGSTVFAFFVSRTINRRSFHVRDLVNATFSGGIALGSAHSLILAPGPALLVGATAGTFVVLSQSFFQPWMERKFPFKIYDTRGTVNNHLISGIIAGIASAIATGVSETHVFGQPAESLFPKGLPSQGGIQAGALFISIGIALGTGIVLGIALYLGRRFTASAIPPIFRDEFQFNMPTDYPRDPAMGGIPEP